MTTNDLTPTPGQTIGPFFGYFNAAEQVHLPFENGDNLVPPGHADAIQLTTTKKVARTGCRGGWCRR